MAATVSSVWAKPGAWALDSEQHEDELNLQAQQEALKAPPSPPATDFPSLSAAAAAKPKKKNKGQTLSLAAFTTYAPPNKTAPSDEMLMLPTGPRQRTAEELDRTRLGGGFRNYGGDRDRDRDNSRVRVSREGYERGDRDMGPSRADEVDDWSKTKKFGSSFDSRSRSGSGSGQDMGPSRADEVDDWSKGKKFGSSFDSRSGSGPGQDMGRADEVDDWSKGKKFGSSFDSRSGSGPERREKVGFFNSSRADEVDNWASAKSVAPPPLPVDGARRERRGMGFDSYSNGSGPDADNWLKRRESGNGSGAGGERPRLNLQPRTLPVANNNDPGQTEGGKAKGANPFGLARPREEVLKEKGKDWKEIDEKLEALKMKEKEELSGGEKNEGFTKRRGFGSGRSDSGDDRFAKSWRKPETDDAAAPPSSAEETEKSTEETEDPTNTENAPEEN